MKARVVIIGAGASGLQCANKLVQQNIGLSAEDIIILEARDRVGGRIETITETSKTIQGELVPLTVDLGAAWVHGIGVDWGVPLDKYNQLARPFPNPMMELLLQEAALRSIDDDTKTLPTTTSTKSANIYTKYLKNHGLSGNPWICPGSVLHTKTDPNVAIFVDGMPIDENSPIIQSALKLHDKIIRKVSQLGKQQLIDEKLNQRVDHTSLQDMISLATSYDRSCNHDHNAKNIVERDDDNDNCKQCKDVLATNGSYDDESMVESIRQFYQHLFECWFGSPASDLQSNAIYQEDGGFDGPHCTLQMGMECVLQPLLRDGIAERIILNQEVTKIRLLSKEYATEQQQRNPISITTSTGLEISAECCVMTIPAGCLQANIDTLFDPLALSADKITAIRHLRMGSYKKVFLTFDRIFWPVQPAFIGLIRRTSFLPVTSPDFSKTIRDKCSDNENNLGNILLLDNLWARDGIPCMEAILFGKSGDWATGKKTQEIQNDVLQFIFDSMGIAEDDEIRQQSCTGCHVTRWEEDPYSFGAFSAMSVEATSEHISELNRPEWDGRLIFSGEAAISDTYEGCVHSALMSGKNAAEKVQQLLKQSVFEKYYESYPSTCLSNVDWLTKVGAKNYLGWG
jgi:monoamine oxidase